MKIGVKGLLAAAVGVTIAGAHAQDSSSEDWIKNPGMGNYKAYAEFKMAHYDAARRIWEVLAGLGDADALFNLGILAEDGLGEPRDIAKAEALYVAAANAGGFKAQYRLGMLYSTDGPVATDLDKARRYFGLAAANGDAEAAARLASLAHPERPPTDFERAERLTSAGEHVQAATLYRRLAANGDVTARTRLAWMYEAGRGVERDLAEAARLFLRSAEEGDPEAQYAVAVMYRTGKGQPKDGERSRAWLERSAARNYAPARAALAAEAER